MDDRTKARVHRLLKKMEKEMETVRLNNERMRTQLAANELQTSALQVQFRELRTELQLNNLPSTGISWMQDDTQYMQPMIVTQDMYDEMFTPVVDNANNNATAQAIKRTKSGNDTEEPGAKRPTANNISRSTPQQRAERPPERDFLPPDVKKAIEKTNGILNPVDFRSFLYMTRSVDNPVEMTEIMFSSEINEVYLQMMSLKFDVRREYFSYDEMPSDVREFLDKLDVLIIRFKNKIQETTDT